MEKTVLKDRNGVPRKGVKITVRSALNNSVEKIWDRILNIETLAEICRPMVKFKPVQNRNSAQWEAGREYLFRLYIFGVIPLGNHRIVLETLDGANRIIESREHNALARIWNHRITMEKTGEGTTGYTDEVEIYAGIFTFFAGIWSIMFYRHRQKKWKKIAREL